MYNKELSHALEQFSSISIVQFLILTFVSVLSTALIYVLVQRINGKSAEVPDLLPLLGVVAYVNIMLQLTILGRENGSRDGFSLQAFSYLSNFKYVKLGMIYSFLNFLLFVPFGFLTTAVQRKKRGSIVQKITVSGLLSLLCSLLIEVVQYVLGRGFYEVEDLICNTIGGIFGAFVFMIILLLCE